MEPTAKRRGTPHSVRMRHHKARRFIPAVEELDARLVMNGPSYTVALDPTLDQYGDQISTIQGFVDPSNSSSPQITFGIFDTGASAVTFSADDQSNSFSPGI